MALSSKLQSALKQIQTTQGKDIVIDLVNKPADYPLLCSTHSLGLDEALGGGWAKGRIIEVSGPESSGKTTLALHAIINIQKMGKVAAFIDYEQAFDKAYFEALGGNCSPDKLIFIQPDNAEQGLNAVETLAETGEVALIVVDSTNAAVPKAELDGEAGDLKVGLAARLWSQHLRKVNPTVKNGVTLFYISQMREKIGVMFGDPRVIGVGSAMKYYASQRVTFQKIETLKNGDEAIANKTKAKVIKNKVAPPFKEAIFSIVFGKGVSQDSELVSACLTKGVLIKDGQGVKLGFKTPLWGDGPIETTEAKTEMVLGDPSFNDLKYEIELKLNVVLGKETEENYNELMKPIHEAYAEANAQFEQFVTKANEASGKSLHMVCLYYCLKGLEMRDDKKLQAKLKQMEVALEKKAMSGTSIDWSIDIQEENGSFIQVDVRTMYDNYKNQ